MTTTQIKSKKRVADHGEVFTHDREVCAMLDLVKQETESIESRFLEPACGSGNFLAEILRRKLEVVKKRYKKSQHDCERYGILALTSIYGVELLEDNAKECRDRLLGIFSDWYTGLFRPKSKAKVIEIANFIVKNNIICGDALDMKDKNGQPLVFIEWSAVNSSKIKTRDFTLSQLLESRPFENDTLFSDLGDKAIIPKAKKESLKHYLKLDEDE